MENGPGACYCQLESSSLNDWRGLIVGRLLLLPGNIVQQQAQAQPLEHQRALAILTEGERLARELHDDLANEFNFFAGLVWGVAVT